MVLNGDAVEMDVPHRAIEQSKEPEAHTMLIADRQAEDIHVFRPSKAIMSQQDSRQSPDYTSVTENPSKSQSQVKNSPAGRKEEFASPSENPPHASSIPKEPGEVNKSNNGELNEQEIFEEEMAEREAQILLSGIFGNWKVDEDEKDEVNNGGISDNGGDSNQMTEEENEGNRMNPIQGGRLCERRRWEERY